MTCSCRKDGKFYWCCEHNLYGKLILNVSDEKLDEIGK